MGHSRVECRVNQTTHHAALFMYVTYLVTKRGLSSHQKRPIQSPKETYLVTFSCTAVACVHCCSILSTVLVRSLQDHTQCVAYSAFRSFPLLICLPSAFAPLGNKRHHHHFFPFLSFFLSSRPSPPRFNKGSICLLYTSDAADE